MKLGTKIFGDYSYRRLLYALCFVMFCVIDQRVKTGSGHDGIIETFRDATGIVLACIIFSHYKWEDFVKWQRAYMAWGILGIVAAANAFFWGIGRYPFLNDWIAILVNVILWGYIVIHTIIQVVLEKEYPRLDRKLLVIWGIMMLLMIISRSHYIWPFCYMVMFGCFYLTDFTKEEQDDLWRGCLDGVILSFILFQGFCCVFRPYDAVRYVGIHNNCNLNALYYLAVLAAVFTKIIYYTKKRASKWVKLFFWLLAGAVLSFLFMTIGRISWITAFIIGLIFLGFLNKALQKKQFIQNGIFLVLCAVLMFPIVFGAARYLPSVFHHPVWFWGEWSEDKVHSWDSWDSEKYVDMDELLGSALGRITESVQNLLEHSSFADKADVTDAANVTDVTDVADVTDVTDVEDVADVADAAGLVPDDDPRALAEVLPIEYWGDSFAVRSTIYKYYFTHLNWRGYPYEEQGFQLTRYYWIGHAHNIFLQYGTDFGIPVMILFAALVIGSCAVCWKRGRDSALMPDIAALFFILIPAVFGLFECSWGVGSLSITMLFIAWRQAMLAETGQESWGEE